VSSRSTRLRSPNGWSRGFGPTRPWVSSGANPNAAKAFWLWIWLSALPQALPVCASSLCTTPDPCSCFPPKTPWRWCAGAWKELARRPVSASSLCRSRLSPPRRFGWTHLRTGSGLSNTVQARQPRLLILDPLIRLHRVDENDASQIAALLSYLRQLQRTFQVAVLIVHHARKDANAIRPEKALRGSSELHGWGDSNLYMRRRGAQLTLSTEHRAAASQDYIPLQLTQDGSALALSVASESCIPEPGSKPSALQRVQQILASLNQPITVQQLRKLCGLRTATVCSCLAHLAETGMVSRDNRGYQLNPGFQSPAVSLSPSIDPQGNGNGKHSP
jgi:hypothetical protein